MAVRLILVLCLGVLMMAYMDAAQWASGVFVLAQRCGCSLISGLLLQSVALRGPDEIR